jgi:hypothetical protein
MFITAGGLVAWVACSEIMARNELPATGLAVEDSFVVGKDTDGVTLDNEVQDMGKLRGGSYPITFHITNRSNRQAGLVGGTSGCRAGCCFVMSDERIPIPPGQSVDVRGRLDVAGNEPFEFKGGLYLNDGGELRAFRFTIKGLGFGAETSNASPK